MSKIFPKESSQTLILILFIVIIFTATIMTIANLTTRELEMEEIQERALRVAYAVDTGGERGRFYLKNNSPSSQVKIFESCSAECRGSSCSDCCPDSSSCNSNDCECDQNPMTNKTYYYKTYITPQNAQRPNGESCNQEFCIDVNGGIQE